MFYERNNSVSYTGRAIIPGEFHLKCTNNSWNNGSCTFIAQRENRNTSTRIFLRARCNAICLYKFKDKTPIRASSMKFFTREDLRIAFRAVSLKPNS